MHAHTHTHARTHARTHAHARAWHVIVAQVMPQQKLSVLNIFLDTVEVTTVTVRLCMMVASTYLRPLQCLTGEARNLSGGELGCTSSLPPPHPKPLYLYHDML